jgi:hypothetical protein
MNRKHKIFVEVLAKGESGREAIKQAGYKARGASADSAASRLLKNDEVKAYYDEVMEEVNELRKDAAIMSIKERMVYLSRAVTTPLDKVGMDSDLCTEFTDARIKKVDPLRALDLLNKMDGAYAPEKHEVVTMSIGDLIDDIHEGREEA